MKNSNEREKEFQNEMLFPKHVARSIIHSLEQSSNSARIGWPFLLLFTYILVWFPIFLWKFLFGEYAGAPNRIYMFAGTSTYNVKSQTN